MKRPHQITAVVLGLFSAFVVRESLGLGFYTSMGPGSGFFPFWLGIVVAVMAMLLFYVATFREPDRLPDGFLPSGAGYYRIGAIVLAIAGTVVLLDPLGFRITMCLFLTALLLSLGRQNLLVTAVVALAGSFGVYQVFVELLKVPLPIGVLGV